LVRGVDVDGVGREVADDVHPSEAATSATMSLCFFMVSP